jgi:glycerate kinase
VRRVLAAPDKFRGTATAKDVAEALADGARAAGCDSTALPLADGGEGTLDVFGGAHAESDVHGPLGSSVDAGWRLDGTLAIIELAQASGLALVGGAAGNDPMLASTIGAGELINAALRAGARRIVVAVGGSATTDGGVGAVDVIDRHRLAGVDLVVACDVRTCCVQAADVFAAQKGASPGQIAELRARLERAAAHYRAQFGVDVTRARGGGAAGGLAGGLYALGARLVDGFGLVADHLKLADRVRNADVVLTGEGCLDATSYTGKVVSGVLTIARDQGVSAGVIAGRIERLPPPGVAWMSLVETWGEHAAMTQTAALAGDAARALLTTGGYPREHVMSSGQ